MNNSERIGLGGGCHWCTEAVFSSVLGVIKVEQGWIASTGDNQSFSEAVLVHFDANQVDLYALIKIHLHTHSSTSAHSMRQKYRSAIYTFNKVQSLQASNDLSLLQAEFDLPLITNVLPYSAFKLNLEKYQDYYYSNPDRPFCHTYIDGKIDRLLNQFPQHTNEKALRTINK